jgi:hypothetical protein
MKKSKLTHIFPLLISTSILFTACGPKTIEQQVEKIMESENLEKRQKISYSLADSISIHAAELLFGLYWNPIAIEALENMLTRYSEIISDHTSETESVLKCIGFITSPNLQPQDAINVVKINLIIHALKISNLSEKYEETLISSAKKHGYEAMLKIIDTWYYNKNSNSLLNAIKGFENEAISHLVDRMETDYAALDLLARLGQPVVNTMIEMMKDKKQSVRFAAGDVLVQMLKYEPNAVDILTSAIDKGGIKIIAKNYPFYIRLGQSGTEKLLLKALDIHFNKEMCVDFLNCGNAELETGANNMAAKHGYWVMPSFGSHAGPKWGSGN